MSALPPLGRINRKQKPPRFLIAHRRYLKFLLLDFERRCAYSCQHANRAGGVGAMDVDHFDPTLTQPARNNYQNLFLATRHCNGKKGDNWPTPSQRRQGLRFLNPCEEVDYGVHLFEDPDTFEIWGATPAGRYHVRMLDLNADHLVLERRRRHELRALQKAPQIVTATGKKSDALIGIVAFKNEVEQMIPPIAQKKKPALSNQCG
jgi:hypothetical protein